MMRYRTTEKHPVYKAGLLIEEDELNYFSIIINEEKPWETWETIKQDELDRHIKEGWIAEEAETSNQRELLIAYESSKYDNKCDKDWIEDKVDNYLNKKLV